MEALNFLIKSVYINSSEITPLWFSSTCCIFLIWLGNFIISFINLKSTLYQNILNAKLLKSSLYATTAILFILLTVTVNFDPLILGPQFKIIFAKKAYLGFTAPGLWLSLISTYIITICVVLSSATTSTGRVFAGAKVLKIPGMGTLSSMLVILNILSVLFFSSLDIFILLITYEGLVLPVLFLILLWSSRREKLKAALYYVFYSLLGSITFFVAIFYIWRNYGSTNLLFLCGLSEKATIISEVDQKFLWPLVFIPFATKIPIPPLHLWLPEAHVEASTPVSILLSSVLLKLGGYGFYKFNCVLMCEGLKYYTPMLVTLLCLAILYCTLTLFRQNDFKRIIAYSSIIHMNLAIVTLCTLSKAAVAASFFIMFNHGILSAALFILANHFYRSYDTRLISYISGVTNFAPMLTFCTICIFLCNVSFPPFSPFISEILALIALGKYFWPALVCALISNTLLAVFFLSLFVKLSHGTIQPCFVKRAEDLTLKDSILLYSLLGWLLFFGVFPNYFLFNFKVL